MVATTLRSGEVAIVGYNTGHSLEAPTTLDKIHFVLLKPIGSGTQIFITDRSWTATAGSTALNAGTFAAAGGGDGTLTYTAATDLPAGTVVTATISGGNVTFTVNGVSTAAVSAGGFDLSENGDAVYIYQGAINAPTAFLFAGELADGNTTFNASLVNTGLTVGTTAIAIAQDSGAYNGPTTHAESFLWNGAGSTLLHSIGDSSNWVGDDGGGDNPREQEVQTGPWLRHADVEFWGTMGAGGLANTLSDSTHASGTDDFNHTRQHDGVVNGVQVFWFARDMVFDTVDGKFFVVDSTNGENRILQGNISDLIANPTSVPTLTVLVSDTGTTLQDNYYALDVDIVNNIVYYVHGSTVEKVVYNTANQTPTVLFRMNVDAAGSPSGVGNPAGSTNNFINDMVINFNTGKIYLSSTRVVSGASDQVSKNFIYELSGLTTSSGTDAFTFNASNTGTARLLPFAQNDEAYNPGGSNANSPSTAANQAYFLAQEFGSLDGLAIDQVNNILYFSTGEILFDHDLNSGTPVHYIGGIVGSYALSGNPSGVHGVLYQQTAQFGGTIPGLLGDLEIDTVNAHLYVLDYAGINGVNDDNHWYRMNLNGTGIIQFTQTVGDVDGAAAVGLTLNNAPTLSGSAAGGLAVTEASSAPNSGETAKVTLFTGITIADPNTSTADEITGAVVRIGEGFVFEASSTAGGHTATVDRLYINNLTSGTIAGSGISFTYNSSTGAMVLTGAATVAEYKAAIELVQFSTSGDNVTGDGAGTTRNIYVSVSDGLTMSDEVMATVSVTGINDAPVNTVGGAMNFTEDTTGTVGQASPSVIAPVNAITGISIADADADSTTENFTVTLSVAHGTLTIRTDVTGGLAPGDVTGNGTSSLTLTGTQTEINNTLAATTLPAQGSLPNGLVYTPNANYNGADTLTIVTNDQGNNGNDPGVSGTGTTEADTDTKTLNIADVNDAPTVGGDGTEDSPTILEDTPYTNLNAPTVATLFGGQFLDAIDVQVNGGNPTGSTGDSFAGIAIVVNGSNANGNWQYWDGDSWENIGAASQSAAKTFTAATLIRFSPTLNYNGAAPTLTAHLIETGGPAITNGGTVNLNPVGTATGGTTVYSTNTVVLSQSITAVNDAPVNTVGGTTNATEDGGAVNVTGMSIADVDADPATDIFTVTFDVDHGILNINPVPGGVTNITNNGTATVTVSGTLNQINMTLAFAGGLTYTPSADYNGADRVRVTTNDGGATGQDPGATGTLTTEQDEDDKTIAVAAVNDPVTTTAPATLDVTEDATNVAVTGMSISDVDATLAPNGIYVVTLSSTNGTMSLSTLTGLTFSAGDGTSDATMTFRGTLADINTALATATYTPTGNYAGSAQIQIQASDEFGGTVATGTGSATNDSDTIAVTVTGVNDNPAIANLQGDDVGFVEGSTPQYSDAGGNASVSDVDGGDFDGGTLTVEITANEVASEDVLAPGTDADFTIDGNQVKYQGTTIATFAGGTNGDPLVFTFNSNATPSLVSTVTTLVNYDNTNETTPSGAVRTLTWTLTDGDGGSTAVTSTMTVIPVNDEPSGADKTVSTSEDDAYTFTVADFGFTDPDNSALQGVRIVTLPANGELQLSGSTFIAGTLILKADIDAGNLKFVPDADESGDDYASFTFRVRDEDGTANSGVNEDQTPNTITIDVTPDNLPPTLDLDDTDASNDSTAAYSEDASATLLAPNAAVGDPDDTNLEGATVTISTGFLAGDYLTIGGLASGTTGTGGAIAFDYDETTGILALTGSATLADYQAALRQVGFSSTSNDPGTGRTITWTVGDGDNSSPTRSTTVNITESDDAPTGTSSTATIDEDSTLVLTASHFGFDDDDGNAFAGVRFESAPTGGTLYLDADGAGGADPVAISTYPTDVTAADIAAGNLTFVPTSNLNGAGAGSIAFKVMDDGATNNVDTTADTLTIDIDSVNDAPAGTDVTRTIDEEATYVFETVDFGFSDTDGNSFGFVRIMSLPTSGTLYYDPDGAGGSPAQALTTTGLAVSTTSEIDLGYLYYVPNGDVNGTGADSFTFAVIDSGGTDNGGQNEDQSPNTFTFDIDGVNDGPTHSFTSSETIDEGGSVTWSTAGLNPIVVGDVDAGSADLTTTLSIADGALSVGTVMAGLVVTGEGTSTVTLTGTLAEINDALDGLSYAPPADANGSRTLTITTNDGGATGSDPGLTGDGDDESSTDQIGITIDSINDAPSGADKTVSTSEDDAYTFVVGDFGFTDAADGDSLSGVVITTLPSAGTLLLSGSPVGQGDTIDVADIIAGNLTFQPVADAFASPYASFTFQVVDDGGTPGVDTDQSANTMTINVTADVINGTSGDDTLVGTPQPDTMNGLGGNDVIYGMGSSDTMDGGEGNDYLDGDGGSDTMTGGTGNDRYVVEAGDTIVELDGEGLDIVYSRTSFALAAGVSIELLATANYLGTDPIDLTGNELNNAVTGNNGNNTLKGAAGDDFLTGLEGHDFLDGGAGRDIMVGGLGNDRYFVDQANDVIREFAGEGSDIVYASVSYSLAAGMEVEKLAVLNGAGTDPINLAGNEHNNIVQGNDGANVLNGGAGDDSVIGLGGDDTIDGGAGRDILTGGSGADTFRFTSTSHSAPGAGDRIMDFVSGTDRIDLSLIDANTLLAGDQAFTFIGTAAFSGVAGQLRYDVVGGRMHIYGDTNGDGLVDMHIAVDGTIIASGDFNF